MEELLILVSPKDRQTGFAPKMQVHQKGLRHRAFSVFIFDRNARLYCNSAHRANTTRQAFGPTPVVAIRVTVNER